jgi:hypothetical protein
MHKSKHVNRTNTKSVRCFSEHKWMTIFTDLLVQWRNIDAFHRTCSVESENQLTKIGSRQNCTSLEREAHLDFLLSAVPAVSRRSNASQVAHMVITPLSPPVQDAARVLCSPSLRIARAVADTRFRRDIISQIQADMIDDLFLQHNLVYRKISRENNTL